MMLQLINVYPRGCGFCDIASACACAVCWHFCKNLVEGDDKEDCRKLKRYQFKEHFRLLCELLTTRCIAERFPEYLTQPDKMLSFHVC